MLVVPLELNHGELKWVAPLVAMDAVFGGLSHTWFGNSQGINWKLDIQVLVWNAYLTQPVMKAAPLFV